MRKQYLHLSVYSCEQCKGPVASASLAVRENAISRETDIRQVGAMCLSCGHRQDGVTGTARVRHFPPVEWEPASVAEPENPTTALVEEVNAELR